MPTFHGPGITTTSTAVSVTYSTAGQQLFGVPFIVRHVFGDAIHQQTTVVDSAGSHLVTTTAFTTSKPTA